METTNGRLAEKTQNFNFYIFLVKLSYFFLNTSLFDTDSPTGKRRYKVFQCIYREKERFFHSIFRHCLSVVHDTEDSESYENEKKIRVVWNQVEDCDDNNKKKINRKKKELFGTFLKPGQVTNR